MKNKIIAITALSLFSGLANLNAQSIWAPTTTIGLGSTQGTGIGTNAPRGSFDVRANCVTGGMATLYVTGNSGFLTCGFGTSFGDVCRFRTETSAGVYREDFIVKAATGKIGIGTVNPVTRLHVNDGSLKFTGIDPSYGAPNIVWGGTATFAPDGEWALEYNTNLYGYAGLNFWRPNNSHNGSGGTQATVNNVLFLSNDNRVGIKTNNPTADLTVYGKALIGDPAFVNINTTNTYGLYVQSGILTSKVRVATVNSVNWADYVFQPGYHLRPLNEVNAFIGLNHHLPGVPSAQEVEKDGVDLLQMNVTLLEKVEELTLYLIQQQQQIDELKAKIEQK